MKYKNISFLAITAIGISALISSCSSTKKTPVEPMTFVNVPIVQGTEVSSSESEEYISNPTLKTYAIGRNVKGNSMQLETTVVKKVQSPQWNTRPTAIYGKQNRDNAVRYDPLLGQVSYAIDSMQKEREEMKELVSVIKVNQEQLKTVIESNQKLNERVDELNNKLRGLVDHVNEINNNVEQVKALQAIGENRRDANVSITNRELKK